LADHRCAVAGAQSQVAKTFPGQRAAALHPKVGDADPLAEELQPFHLGTDARAGARRQRRTEHV